MILCSAATFWSSAVLASAQVAGFSVFHASADPTLSQVDVYYQDYLVHPGLAFRQLSFRTDLLAGTPYQLGIAPAGSLDSFIVRTSFTPLPEREYLIVFAGVANPRRFAQNPDGISTAPTLLIQDVPPFVQDSVWLAFAHAATDAPAVRVLRASGQTPYTGLTSFRSVVTPRSLLPADTLTIELYTQTGALIARFHADLSGHGGSAGLLVLSGFTQPEHNLNGPRLGLHAVFLDGTIIEFQRTDVSAQVAHIQFVHASPDPRLSLIDVYVNGEKVLDDFSFRSATGLRELPAAVPLTVGIAPAASQSITDTLWSFSTTLPVGSKLCAVLCGVLSPQNFAPNPNGRPTGLTILALPLQERASSSAMVAVAAVHAVTDAPAAYLTVNGDTLA
ncbi:MAG: DUF4397 domain-containing protein, partial [Candidatus Kapabacteria bacterium]|nr:DUF4397 domain-containing protein [Candidatus Kapabacteria bacterium]